MFSYLTRRIGLSFLTLFLVSVMVFFFTHLMPGDVAHKILGREALPEQYIAFNQRHGFDKSVVNQFWQWLTKAVTGDLGISISFEKPITTLLLPALGYSAKLAAFAFLIIVPLSVGGGIAAAMNRGKTIDRSITVIGLSAAVIPEFVWAVAFVLIFGVVFPVFPVTAFPDGGGSLLIQMYYMTLPSIALLMVLFGYISRITRAGVIESLDSDYMRTASLKGLSRRQAVLKHVLRNAVLPAISVVASQVPYLIGGLVSVEIIFSFPGFGSLLLNAVYEKDYSMIQAGVFLTSAIIIVFQLLADVLFTVLNPRIRQKVSE